MCVVETLIRVPGLDFAQDIERRQVELWSQQEGAGLSLVRPRMGRLSNSPEILES
jgi:hypothetical protein